MELETIGLLWYNSPTSMAIEIYRYQYGVVHVSDALGRKEYDANYRVTPITNDWLLSPDRTFEEIDSVLEGRLESIEKSFRDPKKFPKIAHSYGVERPVSDSAARVFAYTELLDEYRVLQDGYATQARNKREEYDQRKEQISKGPGGSGRKEHLKTTLWATTYNAPINNSLQKAQEAKNLQHLILRKAVIDLFSPINGDVYITDALPRIIDEAKELFESDKNKSPEAFKQRKPIDYFVDSLTDYLSNAKDQSLFNRYSYKISPGIVRTQQDVAILDACLQFALDAQSIQASPSTMRQIERLGKSYFSFLKRQAIYKSRADIEGQYPLTGLIFDTYTAAYQKGKPTVLKKVSQFIDQGFSDILSSSVGSSEIKKMSLVWLKQAANANNVLRKHWANPNNIPTNLLDNRSIDLIPSEVIDFMTTDEYRIINGLTNLHGIISKDALRVYPSSISLKEFYKQVFKSPAVVRLGLGIIDSTEEILDFDNIVTHLPFADIIKLRGIEADLNRYSQHTLINAGVAKILLENDQQIELLKSIDQYRKYRHKANERIAINSFLAHYMPEVGVDTETAEKENSFLWNEVLNNSKWFVSPRGDRFRQERDSQLKTAGVESVSFGINKGYAREHRIDVKLRHFDEHFIFWFDTHQNLLSDDHQPAIIDPRMKTVFTNLLLKRLYAITSGLLAKDQGEVSHEDGKRLFEYKRAHYRYLTSTAERPITMESHGAKVHAKEIKEDYGIDIFNEIRRRRVIGTLKANEYLTFVRETTPESTGTLILPNELTYDPSLIQIPL